MFTNVPTHNLYRVAELRQREDLQAGAERRLHKFLAQPSSGAQRLRNRLGSALVSIGIWLTPASSEAQHAGEMTAG